MVNTGWVAMGVGTFSAASQTVRKYNSANVF